MNGLQTEAVSLILALKDHPGWFIHEHDSSKDDPGDPRGGGIIRTLIFKHEGKDLISVNAGLYSEGNVYVGGEPIGTLATMPDLRREFGLLIKGLEREKTLEPLRRAVAQLKMVPVPAPRRYPDNKF